jgi:hypothetical protein
MLAKRWSNAGNNGKNGEMPVQSGYQDVRVSTLCQVSDEMGPVGPVFNQFLSPVDHTVLDQLAVDALAARQRRTPSHPAADQQSTSISQQKFDRPGIGPPIDAHWVRHAPVTSPPAGSTPRTDRILVTYWSNTGQTRTSSCDIPASRQYSALA